MTTAPRTALLAAKLRSLVRSQWGAGDCEPVDFPGGAGLVAGDRAWLLLDREPIKSFGPALVWSTRHGASAVHLLTDDHAEVLARRAGCFVPAPIVWQIDGTSIAEAVPAAPAVAAAAVPAADLAQLLVDADLEVVVEDGIVRGEVNGLEVARIVHGTTSTGIPLDAPMIEVGVGHADRELTAMLHGALSPVDQLARVCEIVRAHRRLGADRHPLNQMAPERWLRARLVADPSCIDLVSLTPIAPAVARPNLRDTAVAMGRGESASGETVVVACSVGIDLELVPAAADARLSAAPEAPLFLVVPERDAHQVTADLAARLVNPAEVRTIAGEWRA